VYRRRAVAGVPPVAVTRLQRVERGDAHAHDFLVLAYFETGSGSLRLGGREWPVRSGDAFVLAPGDVVGVGDPLAHAEGWAVSFPPDGLGPDALLSWRAHPLLLPFARGSAAAAHRLHVPEGERAAWSAGLRALDRELRERRDGYHDAVLAHLTLLLIAVARLAADVVGDLRLRDEPLLADVFAYIERHYAEGISLKDVARAVGLTPGHLTTAVRRRTGRTVQDWIQERRMAQARRLLVETDRTAAEVGRAVGYGDPVYFSRVFKRAHDATPLQWRRAGRG
jgi:AraC family transcriptional activator of pobA